MLGNKFDVISIGDTTLDVFMELDEANAKVICQNGDEDCVIQLAWADKIPVKKFMHLVAALSKAKQEKQ